MSDASPSIVSTSRAGRYWSMSSSSCARFRSCCLPREATDLSPSKTETAAQVEFSVKPAIVHYWRVGMRGGEKVLEALCDLYPNADIFTHVLDPECISSRLNAHRIKTSFIARLPRAKTWYKKYLPLMPLALEQLDLRGYDLVISSESGPAKGIVPPAGALQ